MLVSVGRYKIQEQIGSGSMGRVYRALDTTLDREVALKAIETGPTLDPDLKERFYREARLCARLQHPNIVTVYDLGEADGYAYIAMELLHGRNLKQMIEGRDPVPLREKVESIAQACEALAHAHRSGLVHRDLKPSNIFRTESGQVKILDFGIARMPSSMLTVAGLVLGTPNYMAPEQILGQTLDGRADLFSVSIVLFSWIAFEHPFRSDSIPKRIASQPPERLLHLAPWAGPDLDALLAKALSRDARDRFQTGDELAQALRRAVAGALPEPSGTALEKTTTPGVLPKQAVPETTLARGDQILQPPAGADPSEWRISRFLEALQEFDEAYEVRAVGVAAEALRTVEQLAREDDRFQIAAAEYRSRLVELEGATKAPVPVPQLAPALPSPAPPLQVSEPKTPLPPAPAPSREPKHVAASPQQPVPVPVPEDRPHPFEISDATRLLTAPMLAEQLAPREVSPAARRPEAVVVPSASASAAVELQTPVPSRLYMAVESAASPEPAKAVAAGSGSKPSAGPLIMKVLAGVAVLGALLLLLNPVFRRTYYAAAPSFGTAEVAADHTRLVSGSEGEGKIITELKKGDKVNILSYRPDTRTEWTSVQYVDAHRASEPGYVQLANLTNWSRLSLIEAFNPGAKAGEEQRIRYIAQLQDFLKIAPPEDADRTRLAIAQEQLALAQAAKATGQSPARLEELVRAGQEMLSGAPVAFQQNPEAEKILGSFRQITSSVPPVTVAVPSGAENTATALPPPEPAYSVELDFGRATNAFENGEYERSKRALSRILKHEPSNTKARNFLDRVLAAQKIDPGTGK